MANYYRITAYHKEKDISIIMDSYGYFEKKWQFSADLIRRGFDIIEVSDDTQFLDGNIERLTEPKQDKLILRACSMGEPSRIIQKGLYSELRFEQLCILAYVEESSVRTLCK